MYIPLDCVTTQSANAYSIVDGDRTAGVAIGFWMPF